MAELGVIASIIGIAGVGIKLSKTLYVTGDRAISADHNLRRLATNVSLFSASLKHFAQVMQTNEDLYSPEYEQTARQIVVECEHVFEELTRMAFMANQKTEGGSVSPNDSRKRFSLVQRVKVYFEQPRVDLLIAQLEYLKTTLSVLIQTLNLAAVTAKAKEDSETLSQIASEKIEQERIHVETLILARQLSVVVLNQQQVSADDFSRNEQGELGRVSPVPSEDSSDEPTTQKLLAQNPTPSTSLVKLGRGNLEFLDSAMPKQSQTVPPAMFTSHSEIIDQLLGRWTRLPQMEEDINERNRRDIDLEDQTLKEPVDLGDRTLPKPIAAHDLSAPDLTLQLVDSHGEGGETSEPLYPSNIATQTSYPLSQTGLSSSSSANPGIHRTISSPSSSSQLRPFSPQPNSLNVVTNYGSEAKQLNPYVPQSSSFDHSLSSPTASPRTSLAMASSYDQSSRPSSSHLSQARNPYAAHISPTDSPYGTSPDSDNEDEERNRRLGLGIPWRIRIGTKYWDFLDERLVGPRTPYLPTEPLSWLYSHDYAHTEIAEKWVCEEAIVERSYPYTHVQGDEGGIGNTQGRNQVWRILCALKFKEIDMLVERTIDIYRRKTTTNQGAPSSSRVSDGSGKSHPVPIPQVPAQPWLSNAPLQVPQQPMPPHTMQDATARARADVFNTWQQMSNSQQPRNQPHQPPPPAQQQRSVSFQDMSRQPPRPGNFRPEFVGIPAGPEMRGSYWAPQTGNAPPPSSMAGTVGSNAGPGYAALSAQRGYRERNRDRERDRYGRDRYDGDSDDYDRHRKKGKGDKKKKRSSTAATLAKAAGLMTILDGLDAI